MSDDLHEVTNRLISAACALVDDMRWCTGMKDSDPHKGMGNYLADAVRAYREHSLVRNASSRDGDKDEA